MPTSIDKLLEEAKQLSLLDLEHLVKQLLALQAQRRAPSLSSDETALFLKINNGMTAEVHRRYCELIEKRREESLSPSEYEELLQLTDLSEKFQVERLEALIELSKLRNMPLRDLMDSLGIKPRPVDVEQLQERFQ
jgi:hypothetical protein